MENFSSCSTGRSQVGNQAKPLSLHERESVQEINILIVENHPDCRYLWEVLLQDYGAKVIAYGSIKEALAALSDCVPDLLICEIRFPDESIVPLIDRVKRIATDNNREIPITVTSTYAFTDFVYCFHYLAAEVSAYLLKPIDISDFVDTTLDLLHTKGRL